MGGIGHELPEKIASRDVCTAVMGLLELGDMSSIVWLIIIAAPFYVGIWFILTKHKTRDELDTPLCPNCMKEIPRGSTYCPRCNTIPFPDIGGQL